MVTPKYFLGLELEIVVGMVNAAQRWIDLGGTTHVARLTKPDGQEYYSTADIAAERPFAIVAYDDELPLAEFRHESQSQASDFRKTSYYRLIFELDIPGTDEDGDAVTETNKEYWVLDQISEIVRTANTAAAGILDQAGLPGKLIIRDSDIFGPYWVRESEISGQDEWCQFIVNISSGLDSASN